LVFDQTPFYAEMGGQIADTGEILKDGKVIGLVQDVQRGPNGQHIHLVDVQQEIKVGDNVDLAVDIPRHKIISQNHTATHMLDQALRNVLGDTHQAGSLVATDYLRFDFTWNKPLTKEQLQEIEDIVNTEIQKNSKISWLETDIDTAQKMGAVAVFGEKYGEVVRVVSIGDFNKEFDGGTHADSTSELAVFKIISESGIGSGVRRIEAVTGQAAIKMLQDGFNQIKEIANKLKVQKITDVEERVDGLQNDYKALQKKVEELYQKFAAASAEDILINPQIVNDYKLITARIDDVGIEGLRKLADQFKADKNADILLLATVTDGKVNMLAASNITDKVKAGDLIKAVSPAIGGSGGGRPDLAQAGGTDAKGIDKAFQLAAEFLQS
jgi:alanyl-tRNA synthetase